MALSTLEAPPLLSSAGQSEHYPDVVFNVLLIDSHTSYSFVYGSFRLLSLACVRASMLLSVVGLSSCGGRPHHEAAPSRLTAGVGRASGASSAAVTGALLSVCGWRLWCPRVCISVGSM